MTLTAEVQEIFTDARRMQSQAVERLDAGDIRDAAEKAWCATLRATDALILARTGATTERSPETSRYLDELAAQDARIKTLIGRYFTRQRRLHGDCFYLGLCEPVGETERRIRETIDYIRDAEELAQ